MIAHEELTTLLCMSGNGELHSIPKAAVIKGLRRRKGKRYVAIEKGVLSVFLPCTFFFFV